MGLACHFAQCTLLASYQDAVSDKLHSRQKKKKVL